MLCYSVLPDDCLSSRSIGLVIQNYIEEKAMLNNESALLNFVRDVCRTVELVVGHCRYGDSEEAAHL